MHETTCLLLVVCVNKHCLCAQMYLMETFTTSPCARLSPNTLSKFLRVVDFSDAGAVLLLSYESMKLELRSFYFSDVKAIISEKNSLQYVVCQCSVLLSVILQAKQSDRMRHEMNHVHYFWLKLTEWRFVKGARNMNGESKSFANNKRLVIK